MHPRLFRGVTPYRLDGESNARATARLAHSGYPLDLDIVFKGIPGPLRHMCHMPWGKDNHKLRVTQVIKCTIRKLRGKKRPPVEACFIKDGLSVTFIRLRLAYQNLAKDVKAVLIFFGDVPFTIFGIVRNDKKLIGDHL